MEILKDLIIVVAIIVAFCVGLLVGWAMKYYNWPPFLEY